MLCVSSTSIRYTYTFAALPTEPSYIKWFEPKADMAIVHHMLLFGCLGEVAPLHVRSGGMFSAGGGGQPRGAMCAGGDESFMFGWGKNAPPLHMPDGVGFRVGPGAFKNLVLEVHYLNPPEDKTGSSGLVVHVEPGVPPMAASVWAWAAGFILQPRKAQVDVPATCCYTLPRPVWAFGFRVHTHALGRRVWLDRLTSHGATEHIELMGRDPQLPQMFEQLPEPMLIQPGDTLRATCRFDTTNEMRTVSAGWAHKVGRCRLTSG